jgi:hypothetical protein
MSTLKIKVANSIVNGRDFSEREGIAFSLAGDVNDQWRREVNKTVMGKRLMKREREKIKAV